jgi:hypothetical protein
MFRRFLEGADDFHDLLRQKPTSLYHIAGIGLNLNGLPNDAIHVSGFSGEDGDFVKMNAVSQVDGVFSYG